MTIQRKPIDIPRAAALKFMEHLRAYQAEYDQIKRDGIAATARHTLLEHLPKGTRLRVFDVKELFEKMK
jgi:hypothetical protein